MQEGLASFQINSKAQTAITLIMVVPLYARVSTNDHDHWKDMSQDEDIRVTVVDNGKALSNIIVRNKSTASKASLIGFSFYLYDIIFNHLQASLIEAWCKWQAIENSIQTNFFESLL